VPRAQIEAMQSCLHHRGPDGKGMRTWPESSGHVQVAVTQTRLAILDLSECAHQPMSTPDGQVTLVYNGEVYNYVELRRELEDMGHTFKSSGDTEVVLASYLHWGEDCVNHFVGMFAFVVVDWQLNRMLLVRDPMGIKPLYYAQTEAGWVAGSEIKSVLMGPVDRAVDAQVVLRHLRFGVAADKDRTIYAEIRRLLPGHKLSIDLITGKPTLARYYRMKKETLRVSDLSFDGAAAHLRDLFLDSVRLHQRSDVPVGTALSGGIDSSSILAVMRHLSPEAELNAFTFSARGSALNEEPWARIAATDSRANMHVVAPTGVDLLDDLKQITSSWDEPIAGTSLYAQYAIFRKANSEGVKVLLDGQGADEMLGGYERYFAARVASLVRQGDCARLRRVLQASRGRRVPLLHTVANAADCLLPEQVHGPARTLMRRQLMPDWLDETWFHARGALLRPGHTTRAREVLRDQLLNDLQNDLLPHLLRYEDTNSMLWSVESRVPFVIPAIAEFCLSLPEEYLVDDDGVTKAVFRRAMRGVVPDVILNRTDKIGFQPPHEDWLHGHDNSDDLLKRALEHLPFLRRTKVIRLWENARRDSRAAESAWRVVFLSEWASRHGVEFL
jgi:asparagine synthase (glutamine-hydrolysing)